MPRQFFSTNSLTLSRNGVTDSIKSIVSNINNSKRDPSTQVVIAPPAIYLTLTRELADPSVSVSAQNVYDKPNGAFTGELSVEQLKDTKIDWTIVGHSERRVLLREDDDVCPSSFLPRLPITADFL
ncbi:hypothetical protein EIK77_010051 [Talaromyces pinophilus]|nr:hypothetical protein EIK77_010051 [Talaromyces pinophilus]